MIISLFSDEELLRQGLSLHDELQRVLDRHLALSSGVSDRQPHTQTPKIQPIAAPSLAPAAAATPAAAAAPAPIPTLAPAPPSFLAFDTGDTEEEEDDGFNQLLQR